MRVFITKTFRRFQRKERIADDQLVAAVTAATRGLVDADLGGGLIKQRVARTGEGKRGGYRTIIAYRAGERSVFLYGFAKSQRANIAADDLRDLQDFARLILALDEAAIETMIVGDELKEVAYHDEDED